MHNILIKKITIGPFLVNCYLLGCEITKELAVIDPGSEVDQIWKKIENSGYSMKYIINTHGHPDHIGGNAELKEKSGAKIIAHPDDASLMTTRDTLLFSLLPEAQPSPPPDEFINEGDTIKLGKINIEVIHTPGHTPGGVCLLVQDLLFTGDTLFFDGIGRTDFPGGDYSQLITSIRKKIFILDDHLRILPGHGDESTLGREKRENPFVREDR